MNDDVSEAEFYRMPTYKTHGGLFKVYDHCEKCGRFLRHGIVEENGLDELRFTGWTCKLHGEQKPGIEYVEGEP
jgi:hypothetical protein